MKKYFLYIFTISLSLMVIIGLMVYYNSVFPTKKLSIETDALSNKQIVGKVIDNVKHVFKTTKLKAIDEPVEENVSPKLNGLVNKHKFTIAKKDDGTKVYTTDGLQISVLPDGEMLFLPDEL